MRQLLVGDVIDCGARRRPNAVAAWLEGQELTFAQVARQTDELAEAMTCAGVKRGDRVVWQAETCLEAIPMFFATARLGVTFVPINPRYTSDETEWVINHADPVMVLGDKASGHDGLDKLLARRTRDPRKLEAPQEDDTHVIYYTSGTTGQPKGCILSQRTQRLRAGNRNSWPMGGEICMFPQFHMSGWTRVLEHWVEGNEISYVRRAGADELLRAIHERKARSIYCIPAVWQRIFDADKSGHDLSTIRIADSGTSHVSVDLLRGIADLFPEASTTIVYGSTEGGLVSVAGPQEGDKRSTTVGRPVPGVFMEIDETGELLVDTHYLSTHEEYVHVTVEAHRCRGAHPELRAA